MMKKGAKTKKCMYYTPKQVQINKNGSFQLKICVRIILNSWKNVGHLLLTKSGSWTFFVCLETLPSSKLLNQLKFTSITSNKVCQWLNYLVLVIIWAYKQQSYLNVMFSIEIKSIDWVLFPKSKLNNFFNLRLEKLSWY